MTPFSYSRLNNFEQCPKKFHTLSIAKTVKEKETESMAYGKAVHKALELRVGRGRPLPLSLSHLEPMASALHVVPGEKLTELQMAVNADLEPTSWFAKDVYCRAIADLAIKRDAKALMFDYKTGKKSDDFSQLELTSVVFFHHHPEIESIKYSFVWLKDKSITSGTIERHQMHSVWSELAPRIAKYQHAFDMTEFPARPGFHCRWCPIKTCPYWEGKP